jgi:transcriptional regulator with XRE-family HTH domain
MSILHYEENGVEFFTVVATGESGMSQSGLAKLCGVNQQAVNQLLKSVTTSSCPEFLKPLQGKDLTVTTSFSKFQNVRVVKDSVCALILEWYAFESQRPTEKARQAFRQFASLGIRVWIQEITGWSNSTVFQLQPQHYPATTVAEVQQAPPLPDIKSCLDQLASLEHDILVSLKHRHAIHNIVEKPTVVDLSLNRVVHTAVHEQHQKLGEALAKLDSLRQTILAFHSFALALSAPQLRVLSGTILPESVEQLRLENQNLQGIVNEQNSRIIALAKSMGIELNLKIPAQKPAILDIFIEERIKQVTQILMQSQPEKGRKRSLVVAQQRATMLARSEFGESLQDIASDMNVPYSSVKTFVMLARRILVDRT